MIKGFTHSGNVVDLPLVEMLLIAERGKDSGREAAGEGVRGRLGSQGENWTPDGQGRGSLVT
jgi:hypothetical protein